MKFKIGDLVYSSEGFIARIIENENIANNFYTMRVLTGEFKGAIVYNLVWIVENSFKRVNNKIVNILYEN